MTSAYFMTQLISTSLKYTVDDAVRIGLYIRDQKFINRHDAILTACIIFSATALTIILMANDISEIRALPLVVISLIPALIVGVLVYLLHGFISPWLGKRVAAKYFKSSPILNEVVKIDFSEEGITSVSELKSDFVKWGAFIKVTESNTDFLLYTGRYLSGFVPKRSFDSDEKIAALRTLIKDTLREKANLL